MIPVEVASLGISNGETTLDGGATVNVATGSSITLTPVIGPEGATAEDTDFTWSVTPEVPNTQTGRSITISPAAEGSFTATVTLGELTATVTILAYLAPESITLHSNIGASPIYTTINEQATIWVCVQPFGTMYDTSDLVWTVPAAITYNEDMQNGMIDIVTPSEAGSYQISVALGELTASITVNVSADPVPLTAINVIATPDGYIADGATVNKTVGDTMHFVPFPIPSNAGVSAESYVWSSDPTLSFTAGIDAPEAELTFAEAGTYEITVAVGEIDHSFTVVVAPAAPVEIQSVDVFAYGYGDTAIADEATLDTATGSEVTFTPVPYPANADVADEDYVWSVTPEGAALVQTGKNAEVTFTTDGTYTITLAVEELSWSCTVTATTA